MNLKRERTKLLIFLILIIAAPVITAILVFTNPSPDPYATGANLGVLIRVGVGSGVAFGYWGYLARKYNRARDLAQLKEIMEMPVKVVKQ